MGIEFITCYFNFTDSKTIKKNYINFRKKFRHKIWTAEVCLPHQQFFIDDSIKFRINYSQILWQKERMFNILLTYLPRSTDVVAWVDADVIFRNRNLLRDIDSEINRYPVVQLFEKVYERSSNTSHNVVSFAKDFIENTQVEWPAIGFGWAMRKDVLQNGFFDLDIVGNGDALQLISWLGLWDHQLVSVLPPHHRKEYLLWAIESNKQVNGRIGCIKGEIEHMYHGTKENRQYWDRNTIMIDHNYNPNEDLDQDRNGLYIMKNYKIQQELQNYFFQRKTDE
jgi:hypothetical protein